MGEAGDIFLQHIKEHEAIIYKLSRMYAVDRHDLEDMYQETLFQAWKSWPSFNGRSKFSTWLYKVCLNTLLTQQRKKKPAKVVAHVDESMGIYEPFGIKNEQVKALYTAIRLLKETDRALISMHLDGFDNNEIAEIIGISSNHVAVKLYRIKEQLTQLLNTKKNGY